MKAIRPLPDEQSIIIKKADKGSAVVVWGRVDCIKKALKLHKDENVCGKVNIKDIILPDLAETSNYFFKGPKTKDCITDKNLKVFCSFNVQPHSFNSRQRARQILSVLIILKFEV